MEECHDYVQWLFPLHEESAFALVYPILTEAQAASLAGSAEARARMGAAEARFRVFLGLPAAGAPAASSPLNSRTALWAHPGDHNLLRVTRIIRSMRFFGLEDLSAAFWRDADAVADAAGLGDVTRAFWRQAAEAPVWESMRALPKRAKR
jgi:hypothetical protein